jgi:hypothetical protein
MAAVGSAAETTATATRPSERLPRNRDGALQLKRPVVSPSHTSPSPGSCFAANGTASFTPTCGALRSRVRHRLSW